MSICLLNHIDEQDEKDIGVKKAEVSLPSWTDDGRVEFEYLGTY
jgi:hypothetical protein